MESQKIIFTATPGETLKNMLENFSFDTLFILCDTHTQKFALPEISKNISTQAQYITIEAGDIKHSKQSFTYGTN